MAAIIGTDSNDVLFGTGEDDYFDGKAGEDAFNGSFGNDTYVVKNPGTQIIEYPNEGLYDKAIVFFSYTLPENVENVDLEEGIFAYGNRSSNLIEGNRQKNLLLGFTGSDIIYGFEKRDTLNGGGGNDRLFGGGGNDLLIAGKGYDELDGGPGNDTYVVESYAFKITEARGRSNDTLRIPLNYELEGTEIENLVLFGRAQFGSGSSRDNAISGNGSGNVLSGLEGNDVLNGNRGNDTLYGNQGSDRLSGGDGADQLYGQVGNDELLGDRGNDRLFGEAGKDVLTGWGGNRRERDLLVGGDDADVFVLGEAGATHYVGSGYATIADFERSERDKIQLVDRIRDYRLVQSRNWVGSASRDTAIYKGKDLIAIVQDVTNLSRRDLITAPIQPAV